MRDGYAVLRAAKYSRSGKLKPTRTPTLLTIPKMPPLLNRTSMVAQLCFMLALAFRIYLHPHSNNNKSDQNHTGTNNPPDLKEQRTNCSNHNPKHQRIIVSYLRDWWRGQSLSECGLLHSPVYSTRQPRSDIMRSEQRTDICSHSRNNRCSLFVGCASLYQVLRRPARRTLHNMVLLRW